MLKNTTANYGSIAKWLHWVVFLLLAVMLLLGYFMNDVTDKVIRSEVVNIHKLIGMLILLVMLLRATWAAVNPKPLLPFATPAWQRVAERLMHYSLYVLLMAMPICGWLGSAAAGHAPHLWEWSFNLPIAENKEFSHLCFSIHGVLAIVIMSCVSIHILAAVYHHVVKKDGVLLRML